MMITKNRGTASFTKKEDEKTVFSVIIGLREKPELDWQRLPSRLSGFRGSVDTSPGKSETPFFDRLGIGLREKPELGLYYRTSAIHAAFSDVPALQVFLYSANEPTIGWWKRFTSGRQVPPWRVWYTQTG